MSPVKPARSTNGSSSSVDTGPVKFKWHQKLQDKPLTEYSNCKFYSGFTLGNFEVECGQCVGIQCNKQVDTTKDWLSIARILYCFDTGKQKDNRRGYVQWYSTYDDINKGKITFPPDLDYELDKDIEMFQDNRSFACNIDLESIVTVAYVEECHVGANPSRRVRPADAVGPFYVCRFAYGPSGGRKNSVTAIKNFYIGGAVDEEEIYSPGKENIPPGAERAKQSARPPSHMKRPNIVSDSSAPQGSASKRRRSVLQGVPGTPGADTKLETKSPHRNLTQDFDKVDTEANKPPAAKTAELMKHRKLNVDQIQSILGSIDENSRDDSDDVKSPKKYKLNEVLQTKAFHQSVSSSPGIRHKATNPTKAPGTPKKASKKTGNNEECMSPEWSPKSNLRGTPKATRGSPKAGRGTPKAVRETPKAGRGTPKAVRGTPKAGRETPKTNRVGKTKAIPGTPSKASSATPKAKEGSPETSRAAEQPQGNQATPKAGRGRAKGTVSTPEKGRSRARAETPEGDAGTPTARRSTGHCCKECGEKFSSSKTLHMHQEEHHKASQAKALQRGMTTGALELARARLHVCAVPESLPCREAECQQLYDFVERKLHEGTGGCMYISGVPGTGKTATVREVVRMLRAGSEVGDVPEFTFIEVNALKLAQPKQVWVEVWQGLTGKQRVTADHAATLLERRFRQPGPKRQPTVILVDELDMLWTRKQDVLYNLFDWPCLPTSDLIVVAIANTMDLPERVMMARVSSRLGLTRVTFHPYTHHQLQEIVSSRLQGIGGFESDAIQLVARKVAAVSGDARRALDICRRATEMAETDDGDPTASPCKSPRKRPGRVMVGIRHVDMALREMFTSPKIMAIRCCSAVEQLVLRAVLAEFQRTGVEETVLERVYGQFKSLSSFNGSHKSVSLTGVLGAVNRLSGQRLLLTDHSSKHLAQHITLNLSMQDVRFALDTINAKV